MTDEKPDADKEFSAIQSIHKTLGSLSPEAQGRVISYIIALLNIDLQGMGKSHVDGAKIPLSKSINEITADGADHTQQYATFAELYDAAQPQSNPEKALVAGYWLQICQHAEDFNGQSANSELKNLGQGVSNITSAINKLIGRKPSLVLQLRKGGKSRQARKLYKVTVAGVRLVEEMIRGEND